MEKSNENQYVDINVRFNNFKLHLYQKHYSDNFNTEYEAFIYHEISKIGGKDLCQKYLEFGIISIIDYDPELISFIRDQKINQILE